MRNHLDNLNSMIKKTLIISLLIISNQYIFGQAKLYINQYEYDANPAIGLIAGLSGFENYSMELGLAYNHFETRPDNKLFTKPFVGFSLTTDYFPSNSKIRTGNLNLWFNGVLVLGVSNSYLTNGELNNWMIKPYIGLELYGLVLTWGYGFDFKENELSDFSKHIFNLRYYYPIFKLKK